MHPEMDFYWSPLFTQSFLLESDIELIKDALSLILKPVDKQPAPSEPVQIVLALNNYLKKCNNAFLVSERIRLFLLLTLFFSSIIMFISLVTLPISIISVTAICIFPFILFSVNLFTLYNQTMSGYQQEIDWNQLKKACSDYAEKLYPANKPTFDLKKLESISSPISAPCLFPARKISQNDNINANTTNDRLNPQISTTPIDDESLNESLNVIKFSRI